jgi:hypothetical protein
MGDKLPIIFDFSAGRTWAPGDMGYEERLRDGRALAAKQIATCEGIPVSALQSRRRAVAHRWSLTRWPKPAWYGIGIVLGTALGITIGWFLVVVGVLPNA